MKDNKQTSIKTSAFQATANPTTQKPVEQIAESSHQAKSAIGERIREVRKAVKRNQYEFATQLGLKQPSLSQIEKGMIKPSLRVICEISNQFGISYTWLLEGAGRMKREDAQARELEQQLLKDNALPDMAKHLDAFRVVNAGLQGAYAKRFDKPGFVNQLPVMYMPNLDGREARIFEVGAHQSQGGVREGDLLMASRIDSTSHLLPGQLYVLVFDEQVTLCRVAKNLHWQRELRLHVDNGEQGTHQINFDPDQPHEFWQVFACITSHFEAPRQAPAPAAEEDHSGHYQQQLYSLMEELAYVRHQMKNSSTTG
jgi:transcriptional regulator with XRE-family HTH domain